MDKNLESHSRVQTKKWSKKRWFFAIIFMFFAVCYVFRASMNYSGYCFTERRWISDEELIRQEVERIVAYQLTRKYVVTDNIGWTESKKYRPTAPYNTVEEFITENPDYYRIGFHNLWDDFYFGDGLASKSMRAKFNGDQKFFLAIRYKSYYLDDNGIKRTKVESHKNIIGNCGSVSDIQQYINKYEYRPYSAWNMLDFFDLSDISTLIAGGRK